MATIGRLYYGSELLIGPSWPTTVERSAATTVTANATTHTKGAWTELIASTDAAARWLAVSVSNFTNGTDTAALLDIATGASGSETVRIENIGVGYNGNIPYLFPLAVPSGTRVAARVQSVVSSRSTTVTAQVLSDSGVHPLPATLNTIGANTGTSRGVNLPNASTYYQVTASTSQAYQGLVASITAGGSTVFAGQTSTVTVSKGASGSEVRLFDVNVTQGSLESQSLTANEFTPLYLGHIPAGTRLAVQRTAANAAIDVVLHGVPYS